MTKYTECHGMEPCGLDQCIVCEWFELWGDLGLPRLNHTGRIIKFWDGRTVMLPNNGEIESWECVWAYLGGWTEDAISKDIVSWHSDINYHWVDKKHVGQYDRADAVVLNWGVERN